MDPSVRGVKGNIDEAEPESRQRGAVVPVDEAPPVGDQPQSQPRPPRGAGEQGQILPEGRLAPGKNGHFRAPAGGEADARGDCARRKVGEPIQVQVAEVKLSERRISLELPRDAGADEWRKRQEESGPPSAMAELFKTALEKKKR